ncbi:MAG TPA: efflux RND transporter periplasmic adaptor subunit, partial [Rhodopila sp.]|nr:efflux RND transporter periplasmic adaptor subunit [Rhodopila sp.]
TGDSRTGQPIPVVTAEAQAKDVPIYLDALGTVQAFYTVTMKPMVDGPLIAVNFREGQDVRKGDVLAQIDPRTYKAALDSAIAKKAQDEALLANARLDLARYQKLVSNNYTSAQQADTQKAVVAQDEALVQQDQAAIDTARTNLSYTTITAPVDGRTGIRQVDPGNIVHASDTTGIVVLTQIQPISVVFTLPQQTLDAVTRAMAAGAAPVLATEQNPAGGAPRTLDTGTLTVLDNQVDQTTGTIKLKATFPNAQRKLWPGGFVGVRLRTEVAQGAIVVPPASVQRGPQGPYVFTIANNTAHRVPVATGFEDQTTSIVTKGLKAGDTVVVDGASRLSDGSKVNVSAPTAAGPATTEPTAAPGTRPRH